MKKIISFLLFIFPTIIFLCCTESISENTKSNGVKQSANLKNNVIVLELFTSQGCSSCPPADRLLGKYTNDENVIPLSFHVDYWNRLGWTDPYSNAVFSQRQKNYAAKFKLNGVYTPQLVINGEKEMVGSNANKISASIKNEEEQQVTSHINIVAVKVDNDKATISYTIQGSESNSDLNIALVQAEITTPIKAGENSGLKLTNYNVVRNFKTVHSIADGTNTESVDLVPGAEKKDYRIVAYLQNTQTYKILAAAKSAL
jgi:hypothetical protein